MLGHQEHRIHVHPHHPGPLSLRYIHHGALAADPHIVVQHVQPPEARRDGCDQAGQRVEIDLDALPEPRKKATRTKPALDLSPLQMVKRDFAFVVERSVEAGAIIKAATSADRKLISGVNVFDIFEGASVGEGKKSVAIEVLIQPTDKTLTDEDFDALTKKIVGNVEKSTGGTLRA